MGVSRASACSRKSSSLCSGTLDAGQQAALQLAAAPQAYDARDAYGPAGAQVIGPVKSQGGCGACVAFVVLAAAQTAAAMALKTSFRSTLSEQHFYHCLSVKPGYVRSCDTGLSIMDGVDAWLALQRKGTLPVLAACLPYTGGNSPGASSPECTPSCKATLPQLLQGEYKVEPLSSIVAMQRHIRRHGSIMCRMDLWTDMRRFFEADRFGTYKGPPKAGEGRQVVYTWCFEAGCCWGR
jgi:hypothetical protein